MCKKNEAFPAHCSIPFKKGKVGKKIPDTKNSGMFLARASFK
jgi:hypothetical protein